MKTGFLSGCVELIELKLLVVRRYSSFVGFVPSVRLSYIFKPVSGDQVPLV
jgi:hypothetical protein